ncbi:hypothetical protein CC78DRAFT_573151 [Lojkania enalia]|uniref:Uncharacterized protein n=1 Tax=Lojkania enalia TaxID=147567 RepID=A0A9P4NCN3_9PLEO|nr:hypothetical protein CC78DRAFT_573151 [Didymosphaeria enalia]
MHSGPRRARKPEKTQEPRTLCKVHVEPSGLDRIECDDTIVGCRRREEGIAIRTSPRQTRHLLRIIGQTRCISPSQGSSGLWARGMNLTSCQARYPVAGVTRSTAQSRAHFESLTNNVYRTAVIRDRTTGPTSIQCHAKPEASPSSRQQPRVQQLLSPAPRAIAQQFTSHDTSIRKPPTGSPSQNGTSAASLPPRTIHLISLPSK